MKTLRKNAYAVATIVLFIIAIATVALFLALFSASTAVDGTTVGNIYVGDKKKDDDLKKTLDTEVKKWLKNATYTISFQNVDVVIGKEEKLDETGNVVKNDAGEIQYIYNGLYFLDFDYSTTKANLSKDKGNEAFYKIDQDKKTQFKADLEEAYGTVVTDETTYFEFNQLLADIEKDARAMKSIKDYKLSDYLRDGWKNTTVNDIEIANLSESKVDAIVELFDGKQIDLLPQKETKNKLGFSAIDFFSQEEYSELTSSDISIIATGLAAVVQPTSLTVTVKNQGYISDRYYAYNGTMTARVNIKDGTDLRIINPEDSTYVVTIIKGKAGLDGTYSLRFILTGCLYFVDYEIKENVTPIDYSIVYDERSTSFDYDEEKILNPDAVGIDYDYADGQGCYYYVYQKGSKTYLYSYTKITHYLDGTTSSVEVYPKQEFFEGQDELRMWTRDGFKA